MVIPHLLDSRSITGSPVDEKTIGMSDQLELIISLILSGKQATVELLQLHDL